MKNIRRIGAILGTALATVTTASVATATPASAAPADGPWTVTAAPAGGPWVVTERLPTVANQETAWVSVWWKTDRRICDAKVRVRGGTDVDIDYPANTGSYTSFSHGPTLRKRESDYTSFQVTPHFRKPTVTWLNATITYNNCGWHARTQARSTGFLLRVSGWSAG